MFRKVAKYVLIFAAASMIPASTGPLEVRQSTEPGYSFVPVSPEDEDQREWYCHDPRLPATVVEIVTHEGKHISYEDPDMCDSDIAKKFR